MILADKERRKMGAIEQTCRAEQRMTRKEACDFISKALRLEYSTVYYKKIAEFSSCRTGQDEKFFDRAKVIDLVNRKLG